jgi:hypothetical protein
MKTVHVILAFHAHEPLWDLPRRLQRTAADRQIAAGITSESYIRRRLKEGRNVYRDLLALTDSLGVPVSLDITNELAVQLRRYVPSTFRTLSQAMVDGRVHPVYTPAHHTHPALLAEDELADELRLNEELLERAMGFRRPECAGVFFTECSVDPHALNVAASMGYSYVLTPTLDDCARFAVEPSNTPSADVTFRPFRLRDSLWGLPRAFPISQEIWRPITRRAADQVKYQGFVLGTSPVFWDDYRAGRASTAATADEPGDDDPAGPQAVAEYACVWSQAIAAAPDGGLLLYLQDLELMDFGEAALRLLGATLKSIRDANLARLRFVTPAELLASTSVEAARAPRVSIEAASWAPEIRPALRYDGHYPPRGAGRYNGVDADREIFHRRPFVFWEPGRFIAALSRWLLDAFGYARVVPADALTLADEEYRVDRLPERVRLPLLSRLICRACNWGWYPEEGMNKRPFLDAYLIADALLLDLRLRGWPDRDHEEASARPEPTSPLSPSAIPGLARLPELLIDSRIQYLRFGLERWRDERGADPHPALVELAVVAENRRLAVEEAQRMALAYTRVAAHASAPSWRDLLDAVRAYCRAMFLALDHIQRTWGKADADFLIVPMYRFLADVFPPRGPEVLDQIESEAMARPPPPSVDAAEAEQGILDLPGILPT